MEKHAAVADISDQVPVLRHGRVASGSGLILAATAKRCPEQILATRRADTPTTGLGRRAAFTESKWRFLALRGRPLQRMQASGKRSSSPGFGV